MTHALVEQPGARFMADYRRTYTPPHDDRRFDDFALSYTETVQAGIGASGETVAYFAELKATLTRQALAPGRPARVLDFGCGIANTTRALAAAFPRARVTGLDNSAESLEVASRLTPEAGDRISFAEGDDRGLPFADASFDLAFTSCVFHHIDRGAHAFWASELRRVLAPGGSLFMFEHNPFNPLTLRSVRNCPFDAGVELMRPMYTVEMLRAAGFAVRAPHFYFYFPRVLRALRRSERYLRRVPLGAQYFVAAARD